VPPLGVELAQLRTRFQELLPPPSQLVGGSADNRLLSQQAREIVRVARPVAGFDPACSVENKTCVDGMEAVLVTRSLDDGKLRSERYRWQNDMLVLSEITDMELLPSEPDPEAERWALLKLADES